MTVDRGPDPAGLYYPRFTLTDRFPTGCSILSALDQLDRLGVRSGDIRLVFQDVRRTGRRGILAQSPPPGTPVRHGQETILELAEPSLASRFPENLFVTETGKEGRDQFADARRLFTPFDKAGLLALTRLRYWNTTFCGAQEDLEFERFLFDVLGLGETSLARARAIFAGPQRQAWLHILPGLHLVVGNPGPMERILARFLGDPVNIRTGPQRDETIPPENRFRLFNPAQDPEGHRARLGTFRLGERSRVPGPVMVMEIGPLPWARARKYLSWGNIPVVPQEGGALLDLGPACELEGFWAADGNESSFGQPWAKIVYLLQHLLPAHFHIQVRILPSSPSGWALGHQKESAEGFPSTLGAWTRLGAGKAQPPKDL